MTDKAKQLQIEVIARVDGYVIVDRHSTWTCCWEIRHADPKRGKCLPDYFTDNEIDRMVRDLKDEPEVLFDYHCLLEELFALIKPEWTHLVTAEQKVEAYLKAKGKWTKEMEEEADYFVCHHCDAVNYDNGYVHQGTTFCHKRCAEEWDANQ